MEINLNFVAEEGLQKELLEVGVPLSFRPGELIMKSSQFKNTFPMVLSGRVKLIRESVSGDELLMYYVSGDGRPSVTLLFTLVTPPSSNIVKAIAEEAVSCLLIPVNDFIKWLSDYNSWRNLVVEDYLYHNNKLMAIFDQVAFTRIDQRIESYLFEKNKQIKASVLEITHQEIATDLNTSRETVSRLLKRLEEKGIVELSRNRIKILKKN